MNMEKNLTQNYLQSKGFVRDETSAENVNRWHKSGERIQYYGPSWHISITFTDESGRAAAYGIFNKPRTAPEIPATHWVFENGVLRKGTFGPRLNIPEPITVDCFENILSELNVELS